MTDSVLSPTLQDAWLAAQEDAGAGHLGVRLYPYATPPPRDVPTALLYAPNVLSNDGGLLSRAQRADSDQHLARHRILLYTGINDDALAAKLRHELEHVVQWEAKGKPLFDLYRATMAAIDDFIPGDRRGTGMLYNIVPLEVDANAAASRFMRQRLGSTRCDELAESEEGVLFRAQPAPESPARAGVRMVCFAAIAAEAVEGLLDPYPKGGRALIDGLGDDPHLWDALRGDHELIERIADARRVVPSDAKVRAADPGFRSAWALLRDALTFAYVRAREVAGVIQ